MARTKQTLVGEPVKKIRANNSPPRFVSLSASSTDGVRKPHRYRPRTVVLCEIHRYHWVTVDPLTAISASCAWNRSISRPTCVSKVLLWWLFKNLVNLILSVCVKTKPLFMHLTGDLRPCSFRMPFVWQLRWVREIMLAASRGAKDLEIFFLFLAPHVLAFPF